MQLRGAVLPLVALGRVFGIESERKTDIVPAARLVVAVRTPDGRSVDLLVDSLIGEQGIVINS
jgi:chemotaxis protein histidine kinase CheA